MFWKLNVKWYLILNILDPVACHFACEIFVLKCTKKNIVKYIFSFFKIVLVLITLIILFIHLFYKFIYFIYFWLCWVFVAVRGLSLVAPSGGCSSLWCAGFSLWWLLLLRSTGSRRTCGMRAQQLWLTGSRAQAQQLWHTGLVAPRHVGSSWTRDRTRVPCIGRWILNHCTTREVPQSFLFMISLTLWPFWVLIFKNLFST